MKMRKILLGLLVLGIAIGFSFQSLAMPPANENVVSESVILAPGMGSSCETDFIVENMSNDRAELRMTLGEEDFKRDQIDPNDAKAYGLLHSLSIANSQGKRVASDDEATIFNTSEDAKIGLHCME